MSYYTFLILNNNSSIPTNPSILNSQPLFTIVTPNSLSILTINFIPSTNSGINDKTITYTITIKSVSNAICNTTITPFTQTITQSFIDFTQVGNLTSTSTTTSASFSTQIINGLKYIVLSLYNNYLPDTLFNVSITAKNSKGISCNIPTQINTVVSPGYIIPFLTNTSTPSTITLDGMGTTFIKATSTDNSLSDVYIYTGKNSISNLLSPLQINIQNSFNSRGKLCLSTNTTNVNLLTITSSLTTNVKTITGNTTNITTNANINISIDSTQTNIILSPSSISKDDISSNTLQKLDSGTYILSNTLNNIQQALAIPVIEGGCIKSITITNAGFGYKSDNSPIIISDILNGGSGATCVATILGAITSINITNNGSNYTSNTTISINGNGSGASAIPTILSGRIISIQITNTGSGYTSNNTTIVINDNTGSGAICNAIIYGRINSINVTNGGAGYTSNTIVSIAPIMITNTRITDSSTVLPGYYQYINVTHSLPTNYLYYTSPSLSAYFLQSKVIYPTTNSSVVYNYQSPNFYYDGFISIPTISSINVDINNSKSSLTWICGLVVLSGNPTISITTSGITGIGNIFYNSTSFLNYSIVIGNMTPWVVNEKIDNIYGMDDFTIKNNNYIIPSPCKAVNTNINVVVDNSSNYSNTIIVKATAYNLLGNPSNIVTCVSDILYDEASLSFINSSKKTLQFSFYIETDSNKKNTSIGCRIWSTTTVGNESMLPNNYTINLMYVDSSNNIQPYSNFLLLSDVNRSYYDNTKSLLSNNYNKELLIANGLYVTPACTTNYYKDYSIYSRNTLNYSTITSTPTYRYATFGWYIRISDIGDSKYSYINFTLNNSPNLYLSNGINFIDSRCTNDSKLLFYYRFENKNDNFGNYTNASNTLNFQTISNYPFPPFTTSWIDGNTIADNDTIFQINENNYNINTILFSGINTETNTIPTIPGNFKLIIPHQLSNNYCINSYIPPSSTQKNDLYVYCRVGLPMNYNFSFSSVTASFSN